MGRRSFSEVYFHFVWRTKCSRRILYGELEAFVHRRVREISSDLELTLLAVNSAWDHTHMLFRWNEKVHVVDAIKEMKSRTAREWNLHRPENVPQLRWQPGYGLISTRRRCVPTVINYIHQQKQRHRSDALFEDLERTHLPT